MPMINADDGCPIHVEVEGRDGAPVLMLSNSQGKTGQMYAIGTGRNRPEMLARGAPNDGGR